MQELLDRDDSKSFEEGELQGIYLRAKNHVDAKNAQPLSELSTASRISRLSSQGSSLSSQSDLYDLDRNQKYLIVVEANGIETQTALAHLNRVMRQERRPEEENVDTNNCNFEESPQVKRRRVVVIRQPELVPALAAMRY